MKLDVNNRGKIMAALVGFIVIVVIVIIAVLNIDNKGGSPVNTDEPQATMASDVTKLDSIVRDVNVSKVEVISNKNNEQADIILDSIGIDIKNLISYAGSIDPKQNSLHSILIVKPKEEAYDIVRRNITDYAASKQKQFMGVTASEQEGEAEGESEQYKIAKDALIYETGGYIVLVLGKQSAETMDKIRSELEALTEELGESSSGTVGESGASEDGTSGTSSSTSETPSSTSETPETSSNKIETSNIEESSSKAQE